MDKQKLILYYVYFIPITILQSVTTVVMMSVLSVENYGLFTLYLSAINFFFFLTLGIQNGYTLVNTKNKLDPGMTVRLTNFVTLICIGLIIASIPLAIMVPAALYWKLAYFSGIMNVMYIFHKSVFRTEMKIHALNIAIIAFRIIILVDIVIYLLFNDITIMLLGDVTLRAILAVFGTIAIIIMFPSGSKISKGEIKQTGVEIIRLGMPIMIGNWLISIYTIFDKTMLANNKELLGLYSFAITSVLLVRVILIPISEMYFVTLNDQQTKQQYLRKLNLMWIASSVAVVIAGIGAIIAIDYLGIFSKYREALPSLLILLNILPLSVALDIYVYNFLRRSNGRRFMVLATISAAITMIILYTYTSLFTLDLVVYSFVVYVTYLIVYAMFIKTKLTMNDTAIMLFKNVIFTILISIVWFIIL
ncbi:hypothetical protein RZE82_04515 [Mollicutes bacterium LVI A0039]|nr:hypothetical protein RZE82_04515 [Mollicutes bacterium LVI A0039]